MALIIVKLSSDLEEIIHKKRLEGCRIGFIPTMGALHAGHLSLINQSVSKNLFTICSIFVNPTQFNDLADFNRYPKNDEKDIAILSNTACDVVFIPSVSEIYPNGIIKQSIPLNGIDKFLDGKFRPGHFEGVVTVVKRLFDILKPDEAFFGLKDYQQYCVINILVKHFHLAVVINGVETVREQDGLAMSSRNTLLNSGERMLAPVIFAVLKEAKINFQKKLSLNAIRIIAEDRLNAINNSKIDYVEICDAQTLDTVNTLSEGQKIRMFIALFIGKIRLIDNLALN